MNDIEPETDVFYCPACNEEYTLPETQELCVICGGELEYQ